MELSFGGGIPNEVQAERLMQRLKGFDAEVTAVLERFESEPIGSPFEVSQQ